MREMSNRMNVSLDSDQTVRERLEKHVGHENCKNCNGMIIEQ